MESLFPRLRYRVVAKADELAAVSEAPAGQESADPTAVPPLTARARGGLRRRLPRRRRPPAALLIERGAS
jgi:hypothetical protein